MICEPDMAGRGTTLIRMAVGRFVTVALALMLAFSFPALSAGIEMSGIQITAATQPVLGDLATPDATAVTPVAETSGEYDRSRVGSAPAIFAVPPVLPRRTMTTTGIVHVALAVGPIRLSTYLPPGRGPPLVS